MIEPRDTAMREAAHYRAELQHAQDIRDSAILAFGEHLAELYKTLSLRDLATATGISHETIRQLIRKAEQ